MRTIRCDKCGQTATNFVVVHVTRNERMEYLDRHDHIDLCTNCDDAFMAWLEAREESIKAHIETYSAMLDEMRVETPTNADKQIGVIRDMRHGAL